MSNLTKIQVIPAQIEGTNGGTTLRSVYTNTPQNQNLIKKLNALIEQDFEASKVFDFSVLEAPDLEKLQELLSQVIIRFDNDPDYYDKRDYYYLIWYLCQNLVYTSGNSQAIEKHQEILDSLIDRINKIESTIGNGELNTETKTIIEAINELTQKDMRTYWDESSF